MKIAFDVYIVYAIIRGLEKLNSLLFDFFENRYNIEGEFLWEKKTIPKSH